MLSLSRTDTTLWGRWWWTVDRPVLLSVLLLMVMGVILVMAASTSVADQHNWSTFHFVKKHLVFLVPAFVIMIGLSLMSLEEVKKFAFGLFGVGIFALILTLLIGVDIKGARRWIDVGLLSLQPSEFIKPAFAVFGGWLMAQGKEDPNFPGMRYSIVAFGLVVGLLLMQPDLGMTFLVTSVWFVQFFLAGLPLIWILILGILGVTGLVGAYFMFSHVHKRIDQFLNPDTGDRYGELYQITQSMDAFMNGGLFGKGPGEGIVKKNLPDAHADFIFAVAGEEFGFILCALIIIVFAFITLRSLHRVLSENNLFVLLAASGLIVQFGLQAFMNMASILNMMPTKGVTLPFISYGGSSLLALALGMGMLLALTRRRVE